MLAFAAEVVGTAVSFASFLTMAAAMALGIEMEKKRKAAQMSATAVSFFLDHEGHKKFLRAATNQELEIENTVLKATVEQYEEESDYLHNTVLKAERGEHSSDLRCEELKRELDYVKRDRDHFKKGSQENFDKWRKAQEENRDFVGRFSSAMRQAERKVLHPDWPDTEDEQEEEEETLPSEPEDNSPSPQFEGGNDGDAEGLF